MTKNNGMTTRYNNNRDDDNNDYNNRSPGQSLGEERGERARAERGERTVRGERAPVNPQSRLDDHRPTRTGQSGLNNASPFHESLVLE